jgi:putative spermidine/putrescine transport system permease protein
MGRDVEQGTRDLRRLPRFGFRYRGNDPIDQRGRGTHKGAVRLGLRRKRSGTSRSVFSFWLVIPASLFLVGFFILPLLDNTVRSFGGSGGDAIEYYRRLLSDGYYLRVTGATLALSSVVTAASLVFGYPVAYFLVRRAQRWTSWIIFLLIAPLLTSIIMRTFGWQVIFARRGLLNVALIDLGLIDRPLQILDNPISVVVGLVHVLVPFMVLSIASVLRGINPRLEESALVLGAGRMRTFLLIVLPLSLDGIGTGSILVFMLANGSFVTLLLLGGGSMQTLPLLIYQQFSTTRDFGFAAAMSTELLAIALVCLYLQLRLIRRRGIRS